LSGNINSEGDFLLATCIGAVAGAVGNVAGQAVAQAIGIALLLEVPWQMVYNQD